MPRHEVDAQESRPKSRRDTPVAAIVLGGAILGLAAWELSARRKVATGEPFARIRRSVAVAASADAAYGLLMSAEAISRLSPDVAVVAHSPNRWLWAFELPAGLAIGIETVMTDARPGRRLALRSVHGSSVQFEAEFDLFPAADSGETIVTAVVSLDPPPRLPMTLVERPLRIAADRAVANLLSGLRAVLENGAATAVTGHANGAGGKEPSMREQERGIGRVVYGREPQPVEAEPAPPADADAIVEEASKESFPASDPPAYATGAPIEPEPDRREAASEV